MTSHQPMFVEIADLDGVVRLLGEAARLPGGHFARKCHVLDGLCKFIGADEWRWAVFPTAPGGKPLVAWRRECARGISPESVVDAPEGFPPAAETDFLILAARTLDHRQESRLALCRTRPDRPPYGARESRLAALVLEEVMWLHLPDWPRPSPPAGAALSPRQQHVCDLMRRGFSRKEIAARLGISPGTVSSYTRELYEYYHVKSHAELMVRLARREPSLCP